MNKSPKLSSGLPRLTAEDQETFNSIMARAESDALDFMLAVSRIDYAATYTREHILEVARKGRGA